MEARAQIEALGPPFPHTRCEGPLAEEDPDVPDAPHPDMQTRQAGFAHTHCDGLSF